MDKPTSKHGTSLVLLLYADALEIVVPAEVVIIYNQLIPLELRAHPAHSVVRQFSNIVEFKRGKKRKRKEVGGTSTT